MVKYSDDRLYARLRLGRNGLRFNNPIRNDLDPLCPHCVVLEYTGHYLPFAIFILFRDRPCLRNSRTVFWISKQSQLVSTLLNLSHAHADTIRAAVFDFIRDTDYIKNIKGYYFC